MMTPQSIRETGCQSFWRAILVLMALLVIMGCGRSKKKRNVKEQPAANPLAIAQPKQSTASLQKPWLGLVDGQPLTSHYERVATHPDSEPFVTHAAKTSRWLKGEVVQRLVIHAPASEKTEPAWWKTLQLRDDGIYRHQYLHDQSGDYTATPAQPMVPWPLVAGERREYNVRYANGEHANGHVQIRRRDFAHQSPAGVHENCVEIEGVDHHHGAEPLQSESTLTYCRGVGMVALTTKLKNGWTIKHTLKAVERTVSTAWDSPAPDCAEGQCAPAPGRSLQGVKR